MRNLALGRVCVLDSCFSGGAFPRPHYPTNDEKLPGFAADERGPFPLGARGDWPVAAPVWEAVVG